MNKPLYAGFAILELSKLLMFKHYYDHLKPKYGEKVKLCFTDTDSFLYHVETDDVYQDMLDDKDLYDTSVYETSFNDDGVPDKMKTLLPALYSPVNKKVPGKFSDETKGHPIKAFVGLRSKVYAINIPSGNDRKVAKGVPKHNKERFKFEMYQRTLKTNEVVTTAYKCIDSKNMQLKTQSHTKVALSAFDSKRYVLDDGIQTLAYGHCRIPVQPILNTSERLTQSTKRKCSASLHISSAVKRRKMHPVPNSRDNKC